MLNKCIVMFKSELLNYFLSYYIVMVIIITIFQILILFLL